MKPQGKLKQLMAKLVELPPTDDKLDLAVDYCSNGEFPTAQAVSDAIIADIQSASSPTKFLWDSCNIDLENEDVGSIVGFDASGGPVLDKYDIVPEGDVSELVVPPSTEVINGLTVTYPPYNSLNPSGQFIMKCMSKWWLKGAFDLVEQAYGLKFDSNSFVTTMPIQLDDIPPSGGAITMAYVMSSYNTTTFKTVSMYCAVNTNPAAYGDMDLTNPNGQANSYAGSNMFLDRVLCHELVHGVMSANISGFNAKLPKYFTEGTAELIAGADDTRKNELLATAGSVSMFQAGLNDNAIDTLRWYTTGYIWLRWYIKHTSKKGVDLSFEHPLPDFEIFEYKVSDGVAFEYGRANNKRFDLIGNEAIDFYTRDHAGLNKWDLCTSPEYLNSKYGSTIRIPFEDAKYNEDIDYISLSAYYSMSLIDNVCMMILSSTLWLSADSSYIGVPLGINSRYMSVMDSLLSNNMISDNRIDALSTYMAGQDISSYRYNFDRGFFLLTPPISPYIIINVDKSIFTGVTQADVNTYGSVYSALCHYIDDFNSYMVSANTHAYIYDFYVPYTYLELDSIDDNEYLSMFSKAYCLDGIYISNNDYQASIVYANNLPNTHMHIMDCREDIYKYFPNLVSYKEKAFVSKPLMRESLVSVDVHRPNKEAFSFLHAEMILSRISLFTFYPNWYNLCFSSQLDFCESEHHIYNTKSPCYYTSFTQLPYSERFDKIRTVDGGTQAYDGVSADILDVNLHTVYDPLSLSYYQGGGTCKEVYDFAINPITNKSLLGLINYHKEDDNSPNVDNNYSYPVYGSGCPWIVYPEKEKLNYDSIYFYLTRDNYSGTITYQLTSNRYSSLKPIFQTIVFGSPDTDNYTSKYPLYVGGGANYVTHTEYTYNYQPPTPPGGNPPPAVPVHVEGNKYSLNLTGTKTSNISPIYPSAESDSGVTNFAFRGSDGEWKYLASFDGSISNDEVLFAHKLADPYYWGIISPYVGSDVDYSYIYDINNDTINIYKPVRVINPYRELKEERGFGAISLSNLYAKCSDNKFGIRKVKTKDYTYNSILNKIENNIIYLIDDFDNFDKLDIIFTDGNNQYTATWHRNSLMRALLNSLDIDFDLTRGIVYNLFWDVNISVSAKDTFYNLSNNCTIVDVVGYKKKYLRYLVLPNSCVHKEFGIEDTTGDISTYGLNNVLCIYLGEG